MRVFIGHCPCPVTVDNESKNGTLKEISEHSGLGFRIFSVVQDLLHQHVGMTANGKSNRVHLGTPGAYTKESRIVEIARYTPSIF